jgi:hypothetical protein
MRAFSAPTGAAEIPSYRTGSLRSRRGIWRWCKAGLIAPAGRAGFGG